MRAARRPAGTLGDARYRPIADYGAIGNCLTAALVARTGSIDWACLPDFDSPSLFGAILDADRGGRFRVAAAGVPEGDQRYLPGTNVLETTFAGPSGRLVVTDYLPVEGRLEDATEPAPPAEIRRALRAEGGPVEVEVTWAPRPDYARAPIRVRVAEGLAVAEGAGPAAWLAGLPAAADVEVRPGADGGPAVEARFLLDPAVRVALATGIGSPPPARDPADATDLDATIAAWRRWANRGPADRDWAAPYADLVARSELALKLLAYRPTGALVAAATTSLPETIGGMRNWDYRFAWIRDASLTVQAMRAVGHLREARDFVLWAERAVRAGGPDTALRIMYDVRGGTDLAEHELAHLEGYRESRPVRIGNGAAGQVQLDVPGELLDGAYELLRAGGELPQETRAFLASVADDACTGVGREDDGLWEMRGRPSVYTYSQLMLWVALDRAIRMADVLPGADVGRWRRARDEAARLVLEVGYDPGLASFVQRRGARDLDATSLLVPVHELIAFDDPRVHGTIDRTLESLTERGLVYRYRMDDGMPGEEGAFVLCTFWLVDALAMAGRLDEAHEIYEGVVRRANHVGLFSEQIDPASGDFLGNMPQAFSHLGLINSSLYLAHAEGRPVPAPPMGSEAHRRDDGDGPEVAPAG
jgi:GH15 family glucan-1,4-alpha-glucosidase